MMEHVKNIPENTAIERELIHITTQDQYRLTGYHYRSVHHPHVATLIVAGATGVPQAFYRRFAEYMATLGYQVITFDYRGIGQSKPPTLKGFEMSYLDWGRVDLAQVIDHFFDQNLPLFVVGHSYGGHALGLLPNYEKITAFYTLGTGAGWSGYMPKVERLKVQLMWNVVFPLMVKKAGYLPWSKLNMGEDLPLNVYQLWRKWCKNPHYCFEDTEYTFLHEMYAKINIPLYAAVALDDAWALPKSRDVFMSYYKNADLHLIDLAPKSFGLSEIGHMGYFRKNANEIWNKVAKTFEQYLIEPKIKHSYFYQN